MPEFLDSDIDNNDSTIEPDKPIKSSTVKESSARKRPERKRSRKECKYEVVTCTTNLFVSYISLYIPQTKSRV